MAAETSRNPGRYARRRSGMSLRAWQSLTVAAILAGLTALMVPIYTSVLGDRTFEAIRQRGIVVGRLLAAMGEPVPGDAGQKRIQETFDRLAMEEDLVHLELVDGLGRVLAAAGSTNRPPQYALFDTWIGAPRAPSRRADTMPGLMGEPLYLFSVPVVPPGEPFTAAAGSPRARVGGRGQGSAMASGRVDKAEQGTAGGEVRLAFSADGLRQAQRDLAWKGAGLGLLAMLAGVLITQVTSRKLVTGPTSRLAGMAALVVEGDLRHRMGEERTDEMGDVADAFNRMIDRLETMVLGLRNDSGHLEEVMEEIKAIAEVMVAGTLNQQGSVRRLSDSAGAVADSIKRVGGSVASLSASSEGTSTSIMQMIALIEEVASHADGLTMSVNDTSATTEEMVSAIREIDHSVEMLNQFVEETSLAMTRMGEVIQQVECNAADSKGISGLVAQNAEKGMRAVELTMEGMEGISGSVLEASRVIESVGRRGQEIGLILNVIQEVTEQTNLLALNAAIIAAQAGEHGRGFAVVAEEIRQLAERTATSAKEIAVLIASFQSETGRAVAAMQEGSRRVGDGTERSREAGRALKEILESARRSSTMVSQIAEATREQARGSEAISASVSKVRGMGAHIKKSTAEQTLGSEQIMSAVENMREMAGHVKRATVEQTRGSRLITQAIEHVTEMVNTIRSSVTEQTSASEQILKALDDLASATTANLDSSTRMREAIDTLRQRSGTLHDEIDHFRVRD